MNKLFFVFSIMLLFFTGCERQEIKEVKLFQEEGEITETEESGKKKSFTIGIAAVLSPKEMFIYYKDLLDYLSEKLSKPILIKSGNYERINNLLHAGEIDMAFVCSGAYEEGHRKFNLQLLVVPVMKGKTVYYSYIITSADSPVSHFDQLEGKSFAFVDTLSNSGYLYPVYLLSRKNKTPVLFFSRIIFTNSHDNSIISVAEKFIDGAAVDSLIYDILSATAPQLIARTKIINTSPPFGIPPVVIPKGTTQQMKEELERFFLNLHKEEKGLKILRNLEIDRFVRAEDSMYDSICLMKTMIDRGR